MNRKIFICYSHADEVYKDELVKHLGVAFGRYDLSVWHDGMIGVGGLWREDIRLAIEASDVAIVLVSVDALRSSFIRDEEISALLGRGATLVPLLVRHCSWQSVEWLERRQMFGHGSVALADMTESARERAYTEITRALQARLAADTTRKASPIDKTIKNYLLESFVPHMERLNRYGLNDAFIPGPFVERHPDHLPQGDYPGPPQERVDIIHNIRRGVRAVEGPSVGGDSATAELAELQHQTREVRSVVEVLSKEQRPLIVLGDPGSGKSMTLRETAAVIAEREARASKPGLVLYVQLARFDLTPGLPEISADEEIFAQLAASIPDEFAELRRSLPALANENRLTVMFDGIDEMPRDGYGARIAALSSFAMRYSRRMKAVFSCRTNDFSPEFEHRQVILARFRRKEMIQFVRLNLFRQTEQKVSITGLLPRGRLTISGQSMGVAEFVDALLDSAGFADIASNPLVLFLICDFVKRNSELPESRGQLFDRYRDRLVMHFRKRRPDLSYLSDGEVLTGWSGIAYLISTYRNGTTIDRNILEERFGEGVEVAIETGREAGLLALDPPPRERVSFHHHRLQEYFTAAFIAQHRPALDWEKMLDSPPWQQTLVHLAGSGSDSPAFDALADGLRSRDDRSEIHRADRAFLASEVLRTLPAPKDDGPATAKKLHEKLLSPLNEAVRSMASSTTATSQVKALWACKNCPDLAAADVLDATAESPVRWVREQSILLAAGVGIDRPHLGRDLPREIAFAAARGEVWENFGSYLRACRARKGARWIPFVALAGLIELAHLCAITAAYLFVLGHAARAAETGTGTLILSNLWWLAGLFVFHGAVLALASRRRGGPPLAIGVLGGIFLGVALWSESGHPGHSLMLASVVASFSGLFFASCATARSELTAIVMTSLSRARRSWSAIWVAGKLRRQVFLRPLMHIFGATVLVSCVGLIYERAGQEPGGVDSPAPPDVEARIRARFLSTTVDGVATVEVSDHRRRVIEIMLFALIAFALFFVAHRGRAAWRTRTLLKLRWATIGEWRRSFDEGDQEGRRAMLKAVPLDSSAWSAEQLLQHLIDLQPQITTDPPSSAYWQKRLELEKIVRHRRPLEDLRIRIDPPADQGG